MMTSSTTFLISETDLEAVLRHLGTDWTMLDLKETIAATVSNGKTGDFFRLSDDVFGILRPSGRYGSDRIDIVLLIRPDKDGSGRQTVLSTM